jgi:hypothetical protein
MFQFLGLFFQKQLQIICHTNINYIKISIEDLNEKNLHDLENVDESGENETKI